MSPAEAALDALAEIIAAKVAAKLAAGALPGMIDQASSPLGRRRHINAVRRRAARGEPGAAIVGRRHLLSREALTEELATLKKRPAKPAEPDPLDALRSKYGLEKGAA